MADCEIITGGVPVDALILVTVDNETIFGNGSLEHPLRAGGSGFTQPLSLPPQCGTVTLASTNALDTAAVYNANSVAPSAHCVLTLPVPLREGDRVESFNVNVLGNGAADWAATLYKIGNDQSETVLITGSFSNPPASWEKQTLTLSAVDTLGVGESYVILYEAFAVGILFGRTIITPPAAT